MKQRNFTMKEVITDLKKNKGKVIIYDEGNIFWNTSVLGKRINRDIQDLTQEYWDSGYASGTTKGMATKIKQETELNETKIRLELSELMKYCRHNQEALDRLCNLIKLLKRSEVI